MYSVCVCFSVCSAPPSQYVGFGTFIREIASNFKFYHVTNRAEKNFYLTNLSLYNRIKFPQVYIMFNAILIQLGGKLILVSGICSYSFINVQILPKTLQSSVI